MNTQKAIVVDSLTDAMKPEHSRCSFISKGKPIFITQGISRDRLNAWVVKIAEESDQDICWFGIGPMYVISVSQVGDIELVKELIRNNILEHDQLYIESIQQKYGRTPSQDEMPGHFID